MGDYTTFLWLFAIVALAIFIFRLIDSAVSNQYIIECFTSFSNTPESDKTSHTVDLPLTNTLSCQNFCGPTARCSVTGQQCMADVDCPGCSAVNKKMNTPDDWWGGPSVPGDNDAGKLTAGQTPQYSPLTSGYGTQERVVTANLYAKPAMANMGVDTWYADAKEGKKIFDSRYKVPSTVPFLPNFPTRYSLTGQFIEEGALPANASL